MNRTGQSIKTERVAARKHAIKRGLDFIYRTACDPENFGTYGFDYLGCFHCIASTSKDPKLRRTAREMGRERALHWRRRNSRVTPNADPDEVAGLVHGSYAAESLGVPDDRLKEQIREAACKFTARDYFGFDPATEPPPEDVPDECVCETMNDRGRKTCIKCRRRLTMTTRYAVWQDALIGSYMGEQFGVRLGTSYADVIKWLRDMRPYPPFVSKDDWVFYDATYAVTHVVYTLNSYSSYQLSRRWLSAEYSFLKDNLVQAIVMEDPETMGEFLDTLKSFGMTEEHPLIRKGTDYLLATQNSDGSWGDMDADDIYNRYHPTWTAIDGLREYSWRGSRLSFPNVASLLN
ncbi:MAG TPA: hypothetical protein VJT71_15220 [Pyrinomonadaceae bacterium]|nr:hypothetical protein [Pyrinomonadaceae bacterium]